MVNIKKIRWVPVLMIISQLMLTGFVAYWLRSQYRDEKNVMQEELARIYEDSRNQVIDSLLFNRVVEPALNDSVTITMISADAVDTSGYKVVRQIGTRPAARLTDSCANTVVSIEMPDSLEGEKISSVADFAFTTRKEDMLIRSVKLFIRHSGDTVAGSGAMSGFLPGEPDTAMFRKVYRDKIAKKDYGVKVTWIADSLREFKDPAGMSSIRIVKNMQDAAITEKDTAMAGGAHFTSIFNDNLPGVKIHHDFPYLFRRILPQVLFGFILLLLTGSAFFFTNRSLRKQLMLNSLRNDFVSNITHELKTPVSTVKVALEALKTFDKVSNPAITRDYLDMAGQEMNRLDQLISKVLDQSMIGEQVRIIEPFPSDLTKLIENTLSTLQPRLIARNATVTFDPGEPINPVNVDPLHVQGVITNLIDNSMKYGSESPQITVRLWQEKGSACIEVSDNGPGIPREYLGRVFDKFFRVPTGDTHTVKGYGLGLSFAALVMKQHQGSISVRNLDSGGCAFTLRFPQQAA